MIRQAFSGLMKKINEFRRPVIEDEINRLSLVANNPLNTYYARQQARIDMNAASGKYYRLYGRFYDGKS